MFKSQQRFLYYISYWERTITNQFLCPLNLSVDKKPEEWSLDWFALCLHISQGELNHYSPCLVLPRHATWKFRGWDWAHSGFAWHSSACLCEAIQFRTLLKVGTVLDLGSKTVRNAKALGKLQKSVSHGPRKLERDYWREQEGSGRAVYQEQAGSSSECCWPAGTCVGAEPMLSTWLGVGGKCAKVTAASNEIPLWAVLWAVRWDMSSK